MRKQKLRKGNELVFKVSERMGNKIKIQMQALGVSAHTPSHYATWFFSCDAVSVAEGKAQKLWKVAVCWCGPCSTPVLISFLLLPTKVTKTATNS